MWERTPLRMPRPIVFPQRSDDRGIFKGFTPIGEVQQSRIAQTGKHAPQQLLRIRASTTVKKNLTRTVREFRRACVNHLAQIRVLYIRRDDQAQPACLKTRTAKAIAMRKAAVQNGRTDRLRSGRIPRVLKRMLVQRPDFGALPRLRTKTHGSIRLYSRRGKRTRTKYGTAPILTGRQNNAP